MLSGSRFGFEISATPGTRRVRASGRLVAGAGADAPEWASVGSCGNVERVLVDLGEVTALDAGGVGRLLALRRALAGRGARLTVTAVSPRVRRVLQLTGLDAILGVASSEAGGGGGSGPVPVAVPTLQLCRCA